MTIRTVAPDKVEYIRVIGSADGDVNYLIGAVGMVVAESDNDWEGVDLVFATVNGDDMVFSHCDVEYISKKEYFKGCLGG